MPSQKKTRVPTQFALTYPFSRPQLVQILRGVVISTNVDDLASEDKRIAYFRPISQLSIGQIKSMPYYGLGGGLLTPDYQLSQFGTHALKNDPLLSYSSTQWLIHYHMSAPHGPGPLYWHKLVCKWLHSGEEFTGSELEADITEVDTAQRGRPLSSRSIKSARGAFTSTYINDDGLASLGILTSPIKGRYLVLEPDPPSVWVFGLALLDFWRARYGFDRLTINLDDLSAPGGLGDIFLIGGGRINQYLRRLQEEGYVEVYRLAPPYQVVLRRHDAEPLLEKLYAVDDD